MERLSLGRLYSSAQQNIARNYARLFAAQTQLTTGKRLNRPSDDIGGTRRVLTLAGEQEAIARHLSNVGSARSHVQSGSGNLEQLTGILAQIRERAVQGASGTLSPQDRENIAGEIDALLSSAVSALNVKVEGRFLFSGTDTGTRPFDMVTGADGLTRIAYRGNGRVQEVDVGPDLRIAMNIPGADLLSRGDRGATTFTGLTGAASGSGSDSGVGQDLLVLAHTQTLYGTSSGIGGQDPVTGLAPSASSAGNDSILGSDQVITVTTDAAGNGTITLNGGTGVPFTPADTDLLVTGPNGESIRVDTSAMTPNLATGTVVPVMANGTYSTDGGLSTSAIDFSATGQQVVDGETGTVLHVNGTGVRMTGTEEIRYEGTAHLLDAIIGIRDALRDPDKSQSDINSLVNLSIGDLDRGLDGITSAIARLGSRANQLDGIEGRLADLDVTLAGLRGEIEDADLSQVVSDMQRFETLYQASLVFASRINATSLLNYM